MTEKPVWRGIPSLAGLCSFEEAQRVGLTVETSVAWMKRHHYLLVRLHEVLTAHITSEPIYELKTAFSLHAYLCAEHATAIRQRVSELREPPLGLEAVPHVSLELLCNEVLCAPTHVELVLGLYEIIIPAVIESLKEYIATTNPLADAPSVRVARFCRIELEDMATFGRQAVAGLVDATARGRLAPWVELLKQCLTDARGVSGFSFKGIGLMGPMGHMGRIIPIDPISPICPIPICPIPICPIEEPHFHAGQKSATPCLEPQFSAKPFQYDPVPKRDARFQDPYNAGVNPEVYLYDERFLARDKVLMLFYKRLREIDVPEMMASILQQTPGKPWKYYRDMSRQLWDEARHAMLGEVGFVHLGIDWTKIPINFTWSRNLNTQLEPWERHAVLFFIEQGLMPRTGKRYEWEIGQASGIPLAGLIQDFDWADEVLHAQIGREWYVKEFGDLNEAMSYGDRCWSQVLSHWKSYRDSGLTDHRNWWPEIYRLACEHWGVTPDPAALAFDTTYETVRADLKGISGSG